MKQDIYRRRYSANLFVCFPVNKLSIFVLMFLFCCSNSFAHPRDILFESSDQFQIKSVDESMTYLSVEENSGESRVGIGVDDPQAPLHVQSSQDHLSPIMVIENTGSNGGDVRFFHSSSSSNPEGVITADPGDVLINSNTGNLYVKSTGNASPTGWSQIVKAGTASVEKFNFTLNANSSYVINHSTDTNDSRLVNLFCQQTTGVLASDTMRSYDPLNYSTREELINDGNVTSFWYNNSSSGSANKWVGYDNGASISISSFSILDYPYSSTYIPSSFTFDTCNANCNVETNWTTRLAVPNHSYSYPKPAVYSLPATVTARYFRVKNIVGGNTTWVVITELELFELVSSGLVRIGDDEVTVIKDSPTVTIIQNSLAVNRQCQASIIGEF